METMKEKMMSYHSIEVREDAGYTVALTDSISLFPFLFLDRSIMISRPKSGNLDLAGNLHDSGSLRLDSRSLLLFSLGPCFWFLAF